MAKKDKKVKKVKVIVRRKKAASKGGGLPKSVKALLGYLGKSDAALSGSSAPQRAQLAPQVQQQQQQQQQQPQQPQFVFRSRAAQGTVIGKSPLASIMSAPQPQQPQNIIIKTAPQREDKSPVIPDALARLNERVLGIEDMGKKVVSGIQSSLKRMDERVKYFEEGWEDVQTLQTPAIKSSIKPNMKETRFGPDVSLGDVSIGFSPVSPQRRLSFSGGKAMAAVIEEYEAGDAQEFFAANHIQNVTNPNLPPVVKVRGRKLGTKLSPNTLESYRSKRAATASAKKAQKAELYQELEQAQSTSLLDTAAKKIIIIKPKQKRLLTPKKRADIDAALSASANIERFVAEGGGVVNNMVTPVPPSSVLRNQTTRRSARFAKGGGDVGDV